MYNIKEIRKKNKKFVRELRKKPTKSEIIVRDWLKNEGVKFIFQKGFFKPFHRIVDFYIPSGGVIVEIDGGIHKFQKEKDRNKDASSLLIRKFETIRITNEQVYSGDFKNLLSGVVANYFRNTKK